MGYLTIFFNPSKKYCPLRLPLWHPLEFQGDISFSSTILLNSKFEKTSTNVPTRSQFQQFLSDHLHSSFKKLLLSTPSLRQGLTAMSLAKSVLDGQKPYKCKRLHLWEPLPVPYVPKKDKVWEEVSKMKNLLLKTSIHKDTTLNFPVWYGNRTKEAMLMHVMATLDAIKKHAHFKAYDEAQVLYVEQKEWWSQQRLVCLCLMEPAKGKENPGRPWRRLRKPRAWPGYPTTLLCEQLFKWTLRRQSWLPRMPRVQWPLLQARCLHSTPICFLSKQSTHETRLLKSRRKATNMWIFKASLNQAQGECPASHSTMSVFWQLRVVLPSCRVSNAAEQEKDYITNVLKKPQHIKVHQFIWGVCGDTTLWPL